MEDRLPLLLPFHHCMADTASRSWRCCAFDRPIDADLHLRRIYVFRTSPFRLADSSWELTVIKRLDKGRLCFVHLLDPY